MMMRSNWRCFAPKQMTYSSGKSETMPLQKKFAHKHSHFKELQREHAPLACLFVIDKCLILSESAPLQDENEVKSDDRRARDDVTAQISIA